MSIQIMFGSFRGYLRNDCLSVKFHKVVDDNFRY